MPETIIGSEDSRGYPGLKVGTKLPKLFRNRGLYFDLLSGFDIMNRLNGSLNAWTGLTTDFTISIVFFTGGDQIKRSLWSS